MSRPLRILIVEDSENDATLLLRELRRSGYTPTYQRVDTAEAMKAALEKEAWDIVISDYVMPGFGGLAALGLLREKVPDLPCIIVSGHIGEETAVEAMKAGARDYLMKESLKRLGPAIERELQEAEVRRERRKADEALTQREEELLVMKKIDQLKDEFIGMVSHELRSPLTVIIGALSTILSEEDKLSRRETRQLVEDAYWEADTLSNILSNLLELARFQANRLHILAELVDMKAVINASAAKIRRQAPRHELKIDCQDSLMVSVDRVRVERILLNLLDNAVKYSPPGSTIQVFARRNDNDVLTGVSDQGIGISAEDQARIFKPFQRLAPTQGKVGGTGLGLIVCQRLVDAHHGRIWVESQPGQGSTFYFTLPALDAVS